MFGTSVPLEEYGSNAPKGKDMRMVVEVSRRISMILTEILTIRIPRIARGLISLWPTLR